MPIFRLAALVAGAAIALPLGSQTLDDLKNDGRNTDNVLTYGMGYSQQRYSPLDKVNKGNVKNLAPVWSTGLENDSGAVRE